MTTRQMIDAIRKGDRLGHKAMQQIADRLECLDKALTRISEAPATYKRHPMVMPGETKTNLFRLGAPFDEIVSGEDDNDGGEAA